MLMGGLYIDTSAIGRVLLDEPDAPSIASELGQYELWASALLGVEFRRLAACELLGPQAERLLTNINLVPLNAGGLMRASTIPPLTVRTLDAIHLDAAVKLRDHGTIEAALTFDKQLLAGCRHHGIPVLRPHAAND